jgi:UDP-N-acetylglucosamine 1-carboxyvinyltransferase
MDALKITGRRRLKGSVNISGAKNAVLPIMAAAMMVDGEVILKNVPNLTDVTAMCTILRELDIAVKRENDILRCSRCHDENHEGFQFDLGASFRQVFFCSNSHARRLPDR